MTISLLKPPFDRSEDGLTGRISLYVIVDMYLYSVELLHVLHFCIHFFRDAPQYFGVCKHFIQALIHTTTHSCSGFMVTTCKHFFQQRQRLKSLKNYIFANCRSMQVACTCSRTTPLYIPTSFSMTLSLEHACK